ncbi:MAG: DUF4430 domain-containing protein [Clostridia bacterium]|nr:DUF4430 domain-containing protein [Clostridia bacterium]
MKKRIPSFRLPVLAVLILLTCALLLGTATFLVTAASSRYDSPSNETAKACKKAVLDIISAQQFPGTLAHTGSIESNRDWFTLYYHLYSPETDLSAYAQALSSQLKADSIPKTHQLRTGLVLSALDGETYKSQIESIIGHYADTQGINAYAWGLILADSGSYETQKRTALIQKLLDSQLEDGGWAYAGKVSDADVTGMVLTSLSPYVSQAPVQKAVEKALVRLRNLQNEDASFSSSAAMGNPKPNTESTAQVVIALCSLGLDPLSNLTKGEANTISALLSFRLPSGQFAHIRGGSANTLATQQAFGACLSYLLFSRDGTRLYDFRTVLTEPETETEKQTETETEKQTESSAETADETSAEQQTETQTGSETESQAHPETESDSPRPAESETKPSPAPGEETGTGPSETRQDETKQESDTGAQEPPDPARESEKSTSDSPIWSDETGKESDRETQTPSSAEKNPVPVWKWITGGGILLAFALYLFLLFKTRHFTAFRILPAVLLVAVLLVILFAFIRVESVRDHFEVETDPAQTEESGEDSQAAPSVYLTIRCDNALPYLPDAGLPQNGVILERTAVRFTEGMTAWDVLDQAARRAGLLVVHTGSGSSIYVNSIAGLSEMDCGDLSGWIYTVNGDQLSYGCGSYQCRENDEILFAYTCDLGHDIP